MRGALPDSPADDPAAAPKPGLPRWPLVVASCLLLLLGWETLATWHQHASAPQQSDWEAASALLRQRHQPGDPVLVAPEWAEATARAHLAGIVDLQLATLSDVDRHARVWELSIRGARHRWLKGREATRSWSPSRVSLALYQQPPAMLLYDFREHLPQAEVALVGERRRTCRLKGQRFVCGRASSAWVGVKIAEVNHRAYRCIYAHPANNKRLRLSFGDVTLGRKIVGYTGIDDFASRRSGNGSVYLQLAIDGDLRHTVKQRNEGHWNRFEVDTSEFAGPRHHVRFEISTDDDKHRTFCFHAETRK